MSFKLFAPNQSRVRESGAIRLLLLDCLPATSADPCVDQLDRELKCHKSLGRVMLGPHKFVDPGVIRDYFLSEIVAAVEIKFARI